MISKQEGGTDRGRLLYPGERGDWAARNFSPLPPFPALYGCSVPAESPCSRCPRLWRLPGDRRGAAGAETPPNTDNLFEYPSRLWCMIG